MGNKEYDTLEDLEAGKLPGYEEWLKTYLLKENELIISNEYIDELEKYLEELMHRAKFYDEHSDAFDVFERLLAYVALIKLGARP